MLHVVHLHLAQDPRRAVDLGDAHDGRVVGGIQFQHLAVGFQGTVHEPVAHGVLGVALQLLDLHAPDHVGLGVVGDVLDAGAAGGGPASRQGRGGGVQILDAHALQLHADLGADFLVFLGDGVGVGPAQVLHLLGPVSGLVGDVRQLDPGLGVEGSVQRGAQGAGRGLAQAPPAEFAADGFEELQSFIDVAVAHHLAQGALGQAQGLLGQLGHFAQGLQGPVRGLGLQFHFRQGVQELGAAGVGLQAFPQVGGRAGEILLDDREPRLGQEQVRRGDHGLGALEDLARLHVLLLQGEGLGHVQVDGRRLLLHPLLVVEVRQLDLVLLVLGVELHDLGELLQGALEKALLGEGLGHLDVDLDRLLDHVRLAVELREALADLQVIRLATVGLLEHGAGLGVEATTFEADAGPLEHVDGFGELAGLKVGVAHPVQEVRIGGIVLHQLEEFIDGAIIPALGHEILGLLGDLGSVNGHRSPLESPGGKPPAN